MPKDPYAKLGGTKKRADPNQGSRSKKEAGLKQSAALSDRVLKTVQRSNEAYKEQGSLLAGITGQWDATAKATKVMQKHLAEGKPLTEDLVKELEDAAEQSEGIGEAIQDTLPGLHGMIKGAQKFMTVLMGNPIILIATALLLVIKAVVDAYKAAREFQRELGTGLINSGLIALKLKAVEANVYLLGLGAEDVKESFDAIRQNFGGIEAASFGFIKNLTKAKLFTGVTAEETAKILAIQESISGLSREALLNQMEANSKMIELRGLAPSTIFKDLAANSEFFATSMKAGSKNVMNTAIQAAKLGVNLDTVSKISSGLLDFETSIEKQMEASMLLGRQINLDKARQLSFMDDHEGMMREILKQVGGEAEFEKLKGFQRRALAEAMNISVEELSRMARTRETAAGGVQAKATTEEKTLNTAEESLKVLYDIRDESNKRTDYSKKTADAVTEAAGG